ncbi:hypothetical protein RHSIM_Rhsim03G0108900 [Rhododendron simsii]|uniref:Uncharacterized protein n=1 Tax=Rhododendron simsii TaxID=118357 RepID=A0A834H3E6_RHOSS|nr:hypothetical protein RHSIM_Rhsim03G0108900 [Rhododendron simsii]
MLYNKFYGDGPGGFTKEFRTKYSIPDDVLVERVSGDRISFCDDFIIIPLFAITEGGVRFPMSPFLRYFLLDYNFAPIQVAVNTWRILCSAMKLAELNNLPFTLGDLMLMYIVSRNPKYDKYYLTTHQHFDHLVDRLYDTEKWGNTLDGLGSGKTLQDSSNKGIPRLLGTKQGSIYYRQVDKPDRLASVCQPGRPNPPRLRTNILRIRSPKEEGEHGGANGASLGYGYHREAPRRTSKECAPGCRGEGPRATKTAKVDDVEVLTTGLAKDDPANPNEPSALFVPDFECPDGHLITISYTLEDSPLLAMTLLKGLALPKDMGNLPTGKAKNMAELCLLIVKVGQCASKAFSDMDVLLETNRSLRVDLQAKRQEVEQSTEQIEALVAKVAEVDIVQQERDQLLLQIKSAEEDNARLKKEKAQLEEDLPKRLEGASDAGYNEAGEYYQQQVQSLVIKAFKEGELKGAKDTHHSSFLRGYQVGLDYAKVPEADHRREPPVVPSLELTEVPIMEEQPNDTTDA